MAFGWCRSRDTDGRRSYGFFNFACCLKPTYSLRRQMVVSFGATGVITILLVIILACLCAIWAGYVVRRDARLFMGEELVIASVANASKFAAEIFSQELDHLRGTVGLVEEVVKDRIAGYPNPGWDEDLYVPFVNFDGQSRYPLKAPLLPRDWNCKLNVNISNYKEHMHELCDLLIMQHDIIDQNNISILDIHHMDPKIGTESAVYFFQGNCDPSETNVSAKTFYPNCTDANNDASTGGVVWPTSTSAGLEQKAADIGVLLKPIWESRPDILSISVHFVNDGAGSVVHFPSFVHDSSPDYYQSMGCDWLYKEINPNTGKPFLDRETSSPPKCHPNGTWVPRREANSMEQDWCYDQVMHPGEVRFHGPIADKFFTPNFFRGDNHEQFWSMRAGRAVFDRYTGELIACVAVDLLLNRWTELAQETFAIQNFSDAVLIRDDGTVVAGGGWDVYKEMPGSVHATNLSYLIPYPTQYANMMVTLNKERAKRIYQDDKTISAQTFAIHNCTTGRIFSAATLPDSPFIYVQVVGQEVFDIIDDIRDEINRDVIYISLVSFVIGGIGIALLMLIVWSMSMVLTRPLKWMCHVTWRIVNHNDAWNEQNSLKFDDMEKIYFKEDKALFKALTPNSEVTELVQEFNQMISGFSGAGRASKVAKSNVHEIRNVISWQGAFRQLYTKANVGDDTKSSDRSEQLDNDTTGLLKNTKETSVVGADTDTVTSNSDSGCSSAIRDGSGNPNCAPDSGSYSDGESREAPLARAVNRSPLPQSGKEIPHSSEGYVFKSALTNGTDYADVLKKTSHTLYGESQPSALHARLSMSPSSDGWRNRGRNVNFHYWKKKVDETEEENCGLMQSTLFRRILILIVIPMIVTNIIIVAVVSYRTVSVLPNWLGNIEDKSMQIQLDSLSVAGKYSAYYAQAVLATPVRDLFLLTRMSEWLFADAISRQSSAFVEIVGGSEECKHYEENILDSCPWYDDFMSNAPCDCKWEMPPASNCMIMGNKDTRRLQKMFYAGQSHDVDPTTGDRVATSYPKVDTTAATTAWWYNVSTLPEIPGYPQGGNASGYETTYDRIRVFSALSAIMFPIYNYREKLSGRNNHKFVGTFIGFDADGMLAGWGGCRHPSTSYPRFQSTVANHASKIRPDLCPLGKFGYDARCRGWYDNGKMLAMEGAKSAPSIHVTPPYEFASSATARGIQALTASSVTQALVDPRNGEYIGQTLVDFEQFEMVNFGLRHKTNAFHFFITPLVDTGGRDTVLGPDPDSAAGNVDAPISHLVLPHDGKNSSNRKGFEEIISTMKEGSSCLQNFTRTTREVLIDGTVNWGEERVWLAYEPVHIRAVESMKADDFSAGVNTSESLVYSVGVGRSVNSLERPYREFEAQMKKSLEKQVSIFLALTVFISILAIAISYKILVSVTLPMVILLRIVKSINAGKIEDDIPPLVGGSREVNQVYTSFAKLNKIVRASNNAFFSRNLSRACHFVRDALKLFTKIEDKKAIAIASSNLGSTLLAINCSRPREEWCKCLEIDGTCCAKEAFQHFHRAVDFGMDEFENESNMERKVEFAEQVSDRFFNRALYYLLSADDPCARDDFYDLGSEDLMKTRALDHDIQEYWINNGLLMMKSHNLFDRLLRRLSGLCVLIENGTPQHVFDPESLLRDCHRLLTAAWDTPEAPIFEEYTRIGRLQQLEGLVSHLHLLRNETLEAAQVGIRMIVEDEYINDAPFQYAAEALLKYMVEVAESGSSSFSLASQSAAQSDIKKMLKFCKQASVDTRKNLFLCMEISEGDQESFSKLCDEMMSFYDSYCAKDDYFGFLASNGTPMTIGANGLPCNQASAAGAAFGGIVSGGKNHRPKYMKLDCKRTRQSEHRYYLESVIDSLCRSATEAPSSSVESLMKLSKSMFAKSCTAVNVALDKLVESDTAALYDSYLVFITDCPKRSWDWKLLLSIKSRIEQLNAKRTGDIHLIIIDVDESSRAAANDEESGEAVEDRKGSNMEGFEATCRTLCCVTQRSLYINASWSSLGKDLEKLRRPLSAGNSHVSSMHCSNSLLAGVTMEKF